MANPFLIQPASYGNQLAGLGQSIERFGQVQEQRKQMELQKQAEAEAIAETEQAMNALEQAYANQDYDAIARLSIRYPQMGNAVMKAIGMNEERAQQNIVDRGFELLANPDNFEKIIKDNPKFAEALGGADELLDDFGNNREEAMQLTNQFLAHAAGDRYVKYKEALSAGEPEEMTEYQSEMIRQKDVEQELRRLEIEQKKLDRQLKRETDELKKKELETKIAESKSKTEIAKQTKKKKAVEAKAFSTEVFNLANEIANDPSLGDITGTVTTMLPTVREESQDLINKAIRLESMLTKENLGLMSGVLTDKDIEMLKSISSGLNVTDGGIKGSLSGTKERLKQISDKVKGAMGNQIPEQSGAMDMSDEDLLKSLGL